MWRVSWRASRGVGTTHGGRSARARRIAVVRRREGSAGWPSPGRSGVSPFERARSKVFFDNQRIHGDHARGQPEFAEQALDGRDLVGLSSISRWPSTRALSAAKALTRWAGRVSRELVEAAAQRLAVEGDHAHALARRRSRSGSERQRNTASTSPAATPWKDPAHPWCKPARAASSARRGLLEPMQVNVDEAVDRAVGIGPRHDREDREQKHVGRPYRLPSSRRGPGHHRTAWRSRWVIDLIAEPDRMRTLCAYPWIMNRDFIGSLV